MSNATGYSEGRTAFNEALGPYLLVGFLPSEIAGIRDSVQGYRAACHDFTFTNCDGNPNSYLAIFQNPTGLPENSLYKTCCESDLINAWIDHSYLIAYDREMSEEFFYQFEVVMGGCGGYLSTKSKEGVIKGVAIGLAFNIGKLQFSFR